ncbi:hypothetical protein BUALT_Bualt19G0021500 [Buddleja alternifolia]|uniref:Uncharacterized protein n=1 Tax=Buddleja alternifolia TaxID=168488 RepID=A0AAV6W4Z1_9LAMI|nr:hypothetical protein BUALT_Bualt19G0021500 [Buddleja alternifolia]
MIEEVNLNMENRVTEKSTLQPSCGGKQTTNPSHNEEIMLDKVEDSSGNIRGLKIKRNSRSTSGKIPRSGLEAVAGKRKSKHNKESSFVNEHNGQLNVIFCFS